MSQLIERVAASLADDPNALRTPCHLYDAGIAAERLSALREALGTGLIVSLKANPSADLNLRLVTVCTDGWEVASLRELNLVAANLARRILVNTPALTPQLMRAAIGAKATLVLDNPDQVTAVIEHARNKPVPPVLLRVNGSILADFVPEAAPGRIDHFGMDWSTVRAQTARCRDSGSLTVAGLHLFAGSYSRVRYAEAVPVAIGAMIGALEQDGGTRFSYVNLGGGFSEHWDQSGFDFAAYRRALARLPSHISYVHEAGRAVFATCGLFITRVLAVKTISDNTYFVCDGGIAHDFLLAGSENRFAKRRSPALLAHDLTATRRAGGGLVVGNSCSRDDVIGIIAPGAGDPAPGDLLAFSDCGAYHATYPMRGFLGLEPADSYVLS